MLIYHQNIFIYYHRCFTRYFVQVSYWCSSPSQVPSILSRVQIKSSLQVKPQFFCLEFKSVFCLESKSSLKWLKCVVWSDGCRLIWAKLCPSLKSFDDESEVFVQATDCSLTRADGYTGDVVKKNIFSARKCQITSTGEEPAQRMTPEV